MRFNVYLCLIQLIIFWNQYDTINGEPIIGQNIRQARAGDYPYISSIMKIGSNTHTLGGIHYCTGVLITRKDVLTAEHCIEEEEVQDTQIVVGTIDLREGQIYYPFWWITYDQWAEVHNMTDYYHWNDIANIRLLDKVSRNILPARLSRLDNTELFNAEVIIAGWGINNEGNIPDIMNFATVQIIENIVCENRIERILNRRLPVNSRILCTVANPFALVEQGDSGGPLIFRNRLVGINHGVCPITHGTNENQLNLHFGIHFYRTFVNYMKNHD